MMSEGEGKERMKGRTRSRELEGKEDEKGGRRISEEVDEKTKGEKK